MQKGEVKMKLSVSDENMLIVLKALRSDYLNAKEYFKTYVEENDRIGMNTPTEIAEIYNGILNQAHKEGLYGHLHVIETESLS